MKGTIWLTLILALAVSCKTDKSHSEFDENDDGIAETIHDRKEAKQENPEINRFIFPIDSSYQKPKVILTVDHEVEDADSANVFFEYEYSKDVVFSDSIHCDHAKVKFEDFNFDGKKDILIHHQSDARSNWTWHLYLTREYSRELYKVEGFEEIKNPEPLREYGMIKSYAVSGADRLSYYWLDKDTAIVDLGIDITDDHQNGNKVLKKIQRTLDKVNGGDYYTNTIFDENPWHKGYRYRFPELAGSNQRIVERINQDMFEWYLHVDKDHVAQSYFENVWAGKQDNLGLKNHISYDIHRCDQKVYCAEINAERCDYNCGYESSYRSYNLKNGLRFKLLEMFTSDGKDRFTEKLKYKKKRELIRDI